MKTKSSQNIQNQDKQQVADDINYSLGTSPSVTAIQFMKQAALEAHSRLYQMGMDEFISLYNHLFDFYVFDKVSLSHFILLSTLFTAL